MFTSQRILTTIVATFRNNRQTINNHKKHTMADWSAAKKKFLAMPLPEKRKQYKNSNYKTLENLPTWIEYASETSLAEKIPVLQGCEINSGLNEVLAGKITLFQGDITTLEVDCIANAANKTLLGGGGVDGAIHSAAGPSLKEECRSLSGCETGGAKITGGYRLPAKYVIHTVGPVGEKPGLLKNCYKNCLDLMQQNKLSSIAFPCISTGIYGYPLLPAAHIAVYEVRKHLEAYSEDVSRVVFCVFDQKDEQVYQTVLQSYFPLK